MTNTLKETSEELNSASDDFNKAAAGIEAELRALSLGVHAWIDAGVPGWKLGYSKCRGPWGFYLVESTLAPSAASSMPCAFSNAPREVRIQAAECIPALVQALQNAAIQLRDDLTREAFILRGYATELKAGRPLK